MRGAGDADLATIWSTRYEEAVAGRPDDDDAASGSSWTSEILITYEAQLPVAGPRWQGFRRQRDDLSGWIDRRFALSNDPPTLIGSRVRARAEDCA